MTERSRELDNKNKEKGMKKFLKFTAILAGLAVLAVLAIALLTPWMDRWGATDEEVAASFPGDALVPEPASFLNRAITINAAPEYIYPWIVAVGRQKRRLVQLFLAGNQFVALSRWSTRTASTRSGKTYRSETKSRCARASLPRRRTS